MATWVARGAPAFVSVTPVPGSSTGYWATPQPQTTAATPSAAMTRVPPSRPAASRASTARPHSPARITSGNARPVRRLNRAGSELCSCSSAASDYTPEFPLQWAVKDVDPAITEAGDGLPVLAALARQWHAAVDAGHGREDVSAARLALGGQT
jgi:hypothetical protein